MRMSYDSPCKYDTYAEMILAMHLFGNKTKQNNRRADAQR